MCGLKGSFAGKKRETVAVVGTIKG